MEHKYFDKEIKSFDFGQKQRKYCVYRKHKNENTIFIIIYVWHIENENYCTHDAIHERLVVNFLHGEGFE